VLRSTVLQFADAAASGAPGFAARLVDAGQAFALYIKLLFVPTNLHMERSLDGVPAWLAVMGWALVLGIVIAAAIAYRREQYRVAFGLAWFLAAWLPISGIFPLNAPMAEHWMYIPMAGFWWALIEVCWKTLESPRGRVTLAAALYLLGAFFLVRTVDRNQDWDSNVSLFRATLEHNPDTLRVHYNLAVAYEDIERNHAAARRHYRRALDLYQAQKDDSKAAYLLNEEVDVLLSLGRVNEALEAYPKAADHYGKLLAVGSPENLRTEIAGAALGLGRCLLAMGQIGQATRVLQQAAQLQPELQPRVEALLFGAPLEAPA